MSKFTITINDVHIEGFILNMLSLLKNNPGIDFKREGNNFIITSSGEGDNFMLSGKPMIWEQLMQEISNSEEEYEKGEYLTSTELRNEVKSW